MSIGMGAKSARSIDNTKVPKARRIQSGEYGKRIIKTVFRNGREFQLHATKGWRSYRATQE